MIVQLACGYNLYCKHCNQVLWFDSLLSLHKFLDVGKWAKINRGAVCEICLVELTEVVDIVR